MATCRLGADVACLRCGFEPEQLAPPDAAVAARSLARRWGELLWGIVQREEDAATILRQCLPSGWSALEHAGHVPAVFECQTECLGRVWAQPQPVLDGIAVEAGRDNTRRFEDLVAALTSAGGLLASGIERFDGDSWGRVGIRGGQPVTALQLTSEAIHEGTHHLRVASADLALLCKHHSDDEDES